jgi:hypothetical protein
LVESLDVHSKGARFGLVLVWHFALFARRDTFGNAFRCAVAMEREKCRAIRVPRRNPSCMFWGLPSNSCDRSSSCEQILCVMLHRETNRFRVTIPVSCESQATLESASIDLLLLISIFEQQSCLVKHEYILYVRMCRNHKNGR